MMLKKVIAGVVTVIGACVMLSTTASAVTCPPDTPGAGRTDINSLSECMLDPNDTPSDVFPIVQGIINMILGILGIVAVLMIILGGFYFLTSQGDAAKVTKGRNTILYGVVGLIIAFLAFAIVNFVLTGLLNAAPAGDDDDSDEEPPVSVVMSLAEELC